MIGLSHYCSFCGKSQHEVHKLFLGITGDTYICNECVALCANLLLSDLKPSPKPVDMINKLDKWIGENMNALLSEHNALSIEHNAMNVDGDITNSTSNPNVKLDIVCNGKSER